MYDQGKGITRAWLCVLTALFTATACDVEPEELDDLAERDGLRDDDPELVADADEPAPDATEALDDDLLDSSEPGPEPLFPAAACRQGFVQAGARLCISQLAQNATRYRSAVRSCRNQRAQVCSYEDLTYLYYSTQLDASYNPNGRWIGNMVADDNVLCGNRDVTSDNDADIANFEGTCGKNDQRSYWCCHDDE